MKTNEHDMSTFLYNIYESGIKRGDSKWNLWKKDRLYI